MGPPDKPGSFPAAAGSGTSVCRPSAKQCLRAPSGALQVTALLGQASRGEPWSTRAAALAFAQYFWFRHCFLLGPRQSGALHDMVVSMLADKKLEVQELAAVSLSGGDAVQRG